MVGNQFATITIQVRSYDSNANRMSRTLSTSVLNQNALQDNMEAYKSSAGTILDTTLRAVYALSKNSYDNSFINGKVDLNVYATEG